jgi:glycosyltransferase involved in cell wall biosynthesis
MYCILEQSIAARPFTSSLLAPEVDKWGEWYAPQGLPELVALNHEPSQMEWEAADKIVAASGFVRDSLIASGVDEKKIEVFPYGVPLVPKTVEKFSYAGDRPLRILFAGNADLRKGAHHLLEAANSLGKKWVECRVVGNVGLKDTVLRDHSHVVDFRGRVPRFEMEDHFQWADVLILPSLAEGSATVVYEALSFGVPAIVTLNAGALVCHDQNGQVIPTGSTGAVKRAILRYIEDPELLRAHSESANGSTFDVSFQRYERDLISFFKNLHHRV